LLCNRFLLFASDMSLGKGRHVAGKCFPGQQSQPGVNTFPRDMSSGKTWACRREKALPNHAYRSLNNGVGLTCRWEKIEKVSWESIPGAYSPSVFSQRHVARNVFPKDMSPAKVTKNSRGMWLML
ncbi:hypothetical protein Tco_1423992, partial [Tanacetum coccineum]